MKKENGRLVIQKDKAKAASRKMIVMLFVSLISGILVGTIIPVNTENLMIGTIIIAAVAFDALVILSSVIDRISHNLSDENFDENMNMAAVSLIIFSAAMAVLFAIGKYSAEGFGVFLVAGFFVGFGTLIGYAFGLIGLFPICYIMDIVFPESEQSVEVIEYNSK